MAAWVHPRPPSSSLTVAADESFTWVDPAALTANQVTDLFVYLGAAIPPTPYLDSVLAARITVTFIDEAAADPYNVADPYGDGYQRARAAETKLAGLYPPACSIVYVLSDENVSTPGPNDPRVVAHARGIGAGTTRPGWVGYSNRNGIDAARSGAPSMRASWVPRTWGADGTDTLVQEIGSPVAGLDIDTIQSVEWGQWRLGGQPSAASNGGKSMFVGHKAVTGNPVWQSALVDGGVVIRWYGGATTATPYGTFYADALAAQSSYSVPAIPLDAGEWSAVEKRTVATQGSPPAIDTAALAAAIAKQLPAPSGLSATQIHDACHQAVVETLHSAQ